MSSYTQNEDKIYRAIQKAFKETIYLYFRENTKIISEMGAFPSHPTSDIVDTGRLRASQQVIWIDPYKAQLAWSAEYAVYVNQGYISKDGNLVIGRPWHELAASRLNLQATFEKLLAQKLR